MTPRLRRLAACLPLAIPTACPVPALAAGNAVTVHYYELEAAGSSPLTYYTTQDLSNDADAIVSLFLCGSTNDPVPVRRGDLSDVFACPGNAFPYEAYLGRPVFLNGGAVGNVTSIFLQGDSNVVALSVGAPEAHQQTTYDFPKGTWDYVQSTNAIKLNDNLDIAKFAEPPFSTPD